MPMTPIEPNNLLRQALLLWERALRKPKDNKRGKSTESAPPPPKRDADRPPQIW